MKVDRVDLAIITILPEEYEAIYTRFKPVSYTAPSRNRYGISRVQTREGKECTVAITRTSRSGNDASQQLANKIISDLDPQMLLVVGIGGGVPDNDFTLGDVIVSSHIYNFDVNAMKGDQITYSTTGGIHPIVSDIGANMYLYEKNEISGWNNVSSIGISRPFLSLTEELLNGLIDKNVNEIWQWKVKDALKWQFDEHQRGARDPKFLTGYIASSNTLVRNDAVLAQWLTNERDIRAVEMEVAGVYQAAQRSQHQYPVMAIRGISDIVGFKRNDDWKLYACHTAAAFAYAFVTSGIVEPREAPSSSASAPVNVVGVSSVQTAQSSQGDTAMPPQNDDPSNRQDANAIKVFTIYAQDDKKHKERFYRQLSTYTRNKMIDLWDEDRIAPSPRLWQEEIDDHIDTSQIILLLISPNFTYNARCLTSMDYVMQHLANSKKIVIPIYIRLTDWPEAPFEKLLTLPRNSGPVLDASSPETAWYEVAVELRKVCDGLRGRQTKP